MLCAYDDLEVALENGEAQLGYTPPQTEGGPESGQISPEDKAWLEEQADIPVGGKGPYGTVPSGFGWPSAVPIRPSRWDLDTSSYQVASGDTVSGLAATYLGDPARWSEIWSIQTGQRKAKSSADYLYPNEWLYMPPDALATLYAAVGLPPDETGGTPATAPPGGYVITGGVGAGTDVAERQAADKRKKLLLIGGGIAALGIGIWALS